VITSKEEASDPLPLVTKTTPQTKKTMKTTEKEAIREIRSRLKLSRLNPRRLFLVDDGAYRWIGDRADLTARLARILRDIGEATEEEYAKACNACKNLASSCGSSDADFFALPESWRDGSALGPIKPL
jgi:hypothetical protein